MFGYDDQYGDYYDPFSDDVLSIMTQRDKNESLSPITKFWSQPEFLPTSQPAIIVDTEQGNQIDFDDECLSFLREYHSAVNESVEIFLGSEQYDKLTANCSSPLYECLVQKSTKLDDLNIGSKADKTYTTTYTAIRSFNFFLA